MLPDRVTQAVQEPWYLVQLKPGGFDRAVTNLARQGYESFMPMREVTHRRAGRWHTRLRPLFPGYLFVEVPNNRQQWRSINATYGVSQLVALQEGRPTLVAPMIVEALKSSMSANRELQPSCNLKAGNEVRVVSGPFSDMFAKIESVPEQGQIYVLLDLMGRYAKAELAAVDVEILIAKE